jgi:hypothetical protein
MQNSISLWFSRITHHKLIEFCIDGLKDGVNLQELVVLAPYAWASASAA